MVTFSTEMEQRIHVLLSIQKALLGNIFPSLRGITVAYKNAPTIHIKCYLDKIISDEDRETIEVFYTEVTSDFSQEYKFIFETERIDFPVKLVILDEWVYLRKEINMV